MGKDQPREREHRSPRRDESRRFGLAQRRREILPLPQEWEANGTAATALAPIPESTLQRGQNGLEII